MPTKTERILSYLPSTFRARPTRSALQAVVDTFGSELLNAENNLAEIMQSHWVDYADRGADQILDLAQIAALYGLAPRPEESVEEFRQHLKRYVRTFLEGTVTVQGVLRVTAEALGLTIADSYPALDSWWKRGQDGLVTREPQGNDAASLALGFREGSAKGNPPLAGRIAGQVNLLGGADLRDASILRLQVDGGEVQVVDLAEGEADPAAVPLANIVDKVNATLGQVVASSSGGRLVLASPTVGPDSRLEAVEGEADAAQGLLGLLPLVYRGRAARAAEVTGQTDLSGTLDLTEKRYLRLVVDRSLTAEIDCGGGDPAHQTAEGVRDAINAALGLQVASLVENGQGRFLRLTSPSAGQNSAIAFELPAAQDAAARLFGAAPLVSLGQEAQPASVTGVPDLRSGVDLSQRTWLHLRVDGGTTARVNCAGQQPASTQLSEIIQRINSALGQEVARRDGGRLRLVSPGGTEGELVIETPPAEGSPEGDAAGLLLGLFPRRVNGAAATTARLRGTRKLQATENLLAQYLLRVSVDGGPFIDVDLRREVEHPEAATLQEMVRSLKAALGEGTAEAEGGYLVLTSPSQGAGSRVAVEPVETARARRFATRAAITGEAASAIFGFHTGQARGLPADQARLSGQPDLSGGVDLRQKRLLRISVDGSPFVEVDCAGPRPRATLPETVVEHINNALRPLLGTDVASHDGKRLSLVSPTAGGSSQIRFDPPHSALKALLDLEPRTVFGQPASSVKFTGLADLSGGVTLPPDAAIKIGIDGGEAVEIPLTGPEGGQVSLPEVLVAISLALGSGVAGHDGKHVILTSRQKGAASRLVFETPAAVDATAAIFGIAAPRAYQGGEATRAQIVGQKQLEDLQDLRASRFLRMAVDGKAAVSIDCASQAEDPQKTSLEGIVTAINTALDAQVASAEEGRLKLQSVQTGLSGSLRLEAYPDGDARHLLFGPVPEQLSSADPAPAALTGEVDLLGPVDLSQRAVLRLVVDGGRPVDIQVHGADPGRTFADEIVAAINAVFPGMASLMPEGRMRLVSPTAGEGSTLELLPVRYLELIEYPPVQEGLPSRTVSSGDHWSVLNGGAADSYVSVELRAQHGSAGPSLANETNGWRVYLLTTLSPGESARLRRSEDGGLQAEILSPDGQARRLPPDKILSGPLGGQAVVPFAGAWRLTGPRGQTALQLNDPQSPRLIVLRARLAAAESPPILASVQESDLPVPGPLDPPAGGSVRRLIGRLRGGEQGWRLEGAGGGVLAILRGGQAASLAAYQGRVVAASGALYPGEPALLVVDELQAAYDLAVWPEGEAQAAERWPGVTIGGSGPGTLLWQVNDGPQASRLVKAAALEKGRVLSLPRGRTRWRYLECNCSRYDLSNFDWGRFAGGLCEEPGRFDLSRFTNAPPEMVQAVFATTAPPPFEAEVEVAQAWETYRPGAFQVHLPADLPPRFGGRFNQARFSLDASAAELYEGVVAEPPEDQDHFVKRIDGQSKLVRAEIVQTVPIGFTAVRLPFRKPRSLSGGKLESEAQIFLEEEGVPGFIRLFAVSKGEWGNHIVVTAGKSGPALYDVTVAFEGGIFENARQVAAGPALPLGVQELLQPVPVGVLQARAAGVHASVTRQGT